MTTPRFVVAVHETRIPKLKSGPDITPLRAF